MPVSSCSLIKPTIKSTVSFGSGLSEIGRSAAICFVAVACLLLRRLRNQGGCPLFQCRNQGFQLCHLVLQHGNFFLQVR